jgi:Ni/Co efflux regulator RcnB
VRRSVLLVLSVALAVLVLAPVAAAQSDDMGADDRGMDARGRRTGDGRSGLRRSRHGRRRDGQPRLQRLCLCDGERIEQRFGFRESNLQRHEQFHPFPFERPSRHRRLLSHTHTVGDGSGPVDRRRGGRDRPGAPGLLILQPERSRP